MGPGPWKSTIWRDRTTVLTFRVLGKYNNPPSFQDFWPFPKGVVWATIPTEIWKMIFWWLLFKNDIKKCLHTKVLRRGLDGSWPLGFWYLTRKTTVLTFGIFGKYNNPLPFQNPPPPPLSRDLAMLRGLRMARIRPSRLRILMAELKFKFCLSRIIKYMLENI